LSALPVRAQYTLQQALAGLAAQAPNEKPDKPMLLKLAEHRSDSFSRWIVMSVASCGLTRSSNSSIA